MITFEWSGSGSLSSTLLKPIVRVSMLEVAQRPNILMLHRAHGSSIRIYSKMHDIGPQIEVGTLVFCSSTELTNGVVDLDLSDAPLNPLHVSRLRIEESDVQIDSGVIIECEDNRRVIIVAGAYPYSLAIDGLFSRSHVFEPEYPIEKYQRLAL